MHGGRLRRLHHRHAPCPHQPHLGRAAGGRCRARSHRSNDYSLAGIAELLRAIKGVSTHYKRAEPAFLGLLPSLYDRKSRREREMFEDLARHVGKLLFPGVVAKRDLYARAASEKEPVWNMKGASAREAAAEIRGVFQTVEDKMELTHG